MKHIGSATLPANNISQQLYYKELPQCNKGFGESNFQPQPCCKRNLELGQWYKKTPQNIWDTASNYEGGPGFDSCTDIAFARQCFLSQYYNYLSKNNVLDEQIKTYRAGP